MAELKYNLSLIGKFNMKNFCGVFITILLLTIYAYGQSDSTEYTLPQLKLELVENKKDVVYDFDKESNVFILTDSILYADPLKYTYSVNTGLIKKISIYDGNYGWRTALKAGIAGGILGLVVGAIFAVSIKQPGGILIPGLTGVGALLFGSIGGILGLATPYYEIYKISGDTPKRKSIIDKVFKKHKLK